MRVILLPSSYHPVLGGLQTVVHSLAERLSAETHMVKVITNRYPRSLPAMDTIDHVDVRRLQFLAPKWVYLRDRRPDLFLAGLWYLPLTSARLDYHLRRFQPDVVNVHYPTSQSPFVLRLRRRHNFRLVVSLHGYEVERWFLEPDSRRDADADLASLRQLLDAADAVTACSQHLLEHAVDLWPGVADKGYVIHNGIDLARFRDRSAYQAPMPYVFAYGRLTHQKGFDLLLRAFARMVESAPEIRLIIAGQGEDANALESLAGGLGLGGRVQFFGRASPRQVVELLNGAALVAVPSRWEPFGIVALEAMAAGKLLLATCVGGLPEIVPHPPNLLVEPNVDGIAQGLARWLGDGTQPASIAGVNRARAATFSWQRMTESYLQVFTQP